MYMFAQTPKHTKIYVELGAGCGCVGGNLGIIELLKMSPAWVRVSTHSTSGKIHTALCTSDTEASICD